ncbi:MAG: hypothetical protein EOP45_12105, partial [Sphingobacteriaceae bacterium]
MYKKSYPSNTNYLNNNSFEQSRQANPKSVIDYRSDGQRSSVSYYDSYNDPIVKQRLRMEEKDAILAREIYEDSRYDPGLEQRLRMEEKDAILAREIYEDSCCDPRVKQRLRMEEKDAILAREIYEDSRYDPGLEQR